MQYPDFHARGIKKVTLPLTQFILDHGWQLSFHIYVSPFTADLPAGSVIIDRHRTLVWNNALGNDWNISTVWTSNLLSTLSDLATLRCKNWPNATSVQVFVHNLDCSYECQVDFLSLSLIADTFCRNSEGISLWSCLWSCNFKPLSRNNASSTEWASEASERKHNLQLVFY